MLSESVKDDRVGKTLNRHFQRVNKINKKKSHGKRQTLLKMPYG